MENYLGISLSKTIQKEEWEESTIGPEMKL